MVLLLPRVKFMSLVQLSQPQGLVPSQLSSLITCPALLLCPWVLRATCLCSRLALNCVLPLCPAPDVPSEWNVFPPFSSPAHCCLALRPALGASSKPQAGCLSSAPWTSPYPPISSRCPHDRDSIFFIFASTSPCSHGQAFRKCLLNETEVKMGRNERSSIPLCCWDWAG